MDKEFIKKHNLTEAVKRFNMLNEYTFVTRPNLSEDDDDDNSQNNNNQNASDNPQNGGNNMNNPMQGNNNAPNDNAPNDNNQNMNNNMPDFNQNNIEAPNDNGGMNNSPMFDNGDNNGIDDNENPDMNGENNDTPDNMPDDIGDFDSGIETEDMQDGDEVIDVDDLTKSQDATKKKISKVNDKISNLIKIIDKLSVAINNNNEKILDLKKDFERRNPTEKERLNLRSLDSYPYSERPKDFWNKMDKDNYQVVSDNTVSPEEEDKVFQIMSDDVNNMTTEDMYKSFSKPLRLDNFIKL